MGAARATSPITEPRQHTKGLLKKKKKLKRQKNN
jgi:hypothetical protein